MPQTIEAFFLNEAELELKLISRATKDFSKSIVKPSIMRYLPSCHFCFPNTTALAQN